MNPELPDLPKRIDTDRLILRPYRLGDAPEYARMLLTNREHLYEFMPPRLMAIQDAAGAEAVFREQALEWRHRDPMIFGIWEKQSSAIVGEVYLANANWEVPSIELGYFVARDATGRGIASEAARALIGYAFEVLQVSRVELQCSADNLASQRVAARAGFRLEGRLRQRNRKKNGELVDRLWFGLLRSEWEEDSRRDP